MGGRKACAEMNVHSELLVFLACVFGSTLGIKPCPGDTRGDRRCNHDPTHRVCAKIGDAGSSFWRFTGQRSWCDTRGNYGPPHGNDLRCPPNEPTWCICKWATAKWIRGQGCDDSIEFDCDATDVCDLKHSYIDYNVELHPAHDPWQLNVQNNGRSVQSLTYIHLMK